MKKGRKPLDEQIKIQRKLEQLWKGNLLNLNLLEEFQLLNINFPQSKQIFTKDFILQYQKQKNYRCVKIITSNLFIDCRTIRQKQIQKQNEIQNQQDNENQQQSILQNSNIQLSPQNNHIQLTQQQPSIIEIISEQKSKQIENILQPSKSNIQSNNQSIIEIQPIPVTIINKEIIIDDNNSISNSFLESPQSKTQNPKQQQDKISKYLLIEPSPPNSPSLNFSKSLSLSFVNQLMDESFFGDQQLKLSESLFGNIPIIKQSLNQYEQTFTMLKTKINEIEQYQFDQLLIAYNHNFLHLQKIILNDINQIKLLLSKYKKKKPRII